MKEFLNEITTGIKLFLALFISELIIIGICFLLISGINGVVNISGKEFIILILIGIPLILTCILRGE